jgi:plastocyanin
VNPRAGLPVTRVMRRVRSRRIVGAALGAALAVSLASAAPSTAGAPTVTIKGTVTYRFAPKKVTVKKGTAVNWSWNSNTIHNVTFRKLGKHSKTTSQGSYKLTFKHKGTFKYLCTVHGFTGKVVVD